MSSKCGKVQQGQDGADGRRTAASVASVAAPETDRTDDCSGETPTIAVVQDSSAYLDALNARKDANARWVRGLSYDDEVNELYTEYVRSQRRRDGETSAGADIFSSGPSPRWLRYPLYCFVVYILLQLQGLQDSFHAQYRREFPITELQLMRSGRQSGENFFAFVSRVLVPLCLPSLLLSGGAGVMAWKIGTATHHFPALCGIGLAALTWIAVLAQALTLWAACDFATDSSRWECEIPFVFYWLCSVIRVGCPLLSVWAVTPMLDLARHAGSRWRVVMGLPVLAFAVAVAVKVAVERGDAFYTPLSICQVFSLVALAALTTTCWRQEPFEVVIRPVKLHAD